MIDLYLTGRKVSASREKFNWRLLAVCTERHKAESLCETSLDFVRPVPANQKIEAVFTPKDIYFPVKEKK